MPQTADVETLRNQHLLLVDDTVLDSDVDVLLSNVLPRLAADGGTRKLSRYSTLTGPLEITESAAEQAQIPSVFAAAYALSTPREREPEAPPEWFVHSEGIEKLFPAGLPMREEERGVDLLIALARRLHAAVRIADDAEPGGHERIIVPDPDAHPEITVYSQYWITSDLLLPLIEKAIPEGQVVDTSADVPEDQELDGYSLDIDLGEGRGLIELGVMVETALPTIVERFADGPQTAYSIRWHADDDDDSSRQHRRMRNTAGSIIGDLAAAVVAATGGTAVDRDGFLLADHQLEG